jgi:hypothetical protein
VGRGRRLGDLAAGAEAFVRQLGESGQRSLVCSHPPGLDDQWLIEVQSQRRQVSTLLLGESGPHSGEIKVLDPQQEAPAGRASKQPRQDRGPQIAQMKLAGRARRVPASALPERHFCATSRHSGTSFAVTESRHRGW